MLGRGLNTVYGTKYKEANWLGRKSKPWISGANRDISAYEEDTGPGYPKEESLVVLAGR
jgi:hypothetical protein